MSDLESLFDFSDVPDLVAAWPCRRPCSADAHEGLAPRGFEPGPPLSRPA